jgi:hypothetical protein
MYANPHNPEICSVLALACYIFANPGIFTDKTEEQEDGVEVEAQGGDGAGCPCSHKGCLFSGGNQYEQFMDCLHRIFEKYPDELFVLGILPGDLGLHSARKGASSHACSGTTVLPPMVSICLRAMWSMGHVKERYLQFEKAGYQYLGQAVSGLDVNSVKFAVLPPFFDFDGTKLWRRALPGKSLGLPGHPWACLPCFCRGVWAFWLGNRI